MVFSPLPMSFTCCFFLWKNLSQRISLTREEKKMHKKRKTIKGDEIILMLSLSKVKDF